MDWRDFQDIAQVRMSAYLDIPLEERVPPGVPKRFDLVSGDFSVVGDAKYLTLVNRVKLPPAKFMEIAGHVWLLERTPAKRRFLVFGNQREVPTWWLKKYGTLVQSVEFYFLSQDGSVERLR